MRRAIWLVALLVLLPGLAVGQDFIRYYPSSVSSAGGTMTGPLVLPDGTQDAPSLHGTDADSGVHFGSNAVHFSANATRSLTVVQYGAILPSNSGFFWFGVSLDLTLKRAGAAILQLGDNAATAPMQTIKAADSTGASVAGADMTIKGGTGGAGGAQGNVVVDAPAVIGSKTTVLADNTKKEFTKIAVAAGAYGGGNVFYTLYCADASDRVTRSGILPFSVQGGDAGSETCAVGTATSSGDSTDNAKAFSAVTFTCADGGTNMIQLEVQADCTIASPTDIHIDALPIMPITKATFPQT
jgi:hypothetical protein